MELPEEALWHGMDYKFWVEWPEGGGERIPGYVNRVVQDDLTKIFSAQVWQPEQVPVALFRRRKKGASFDLRSSYRYEHGESPGVYV